jgi:pimeloyl-ACP methyl ester carboxylesterase
MTPEQRAQVHLYPDAASVTIENVQRDPAPAPTTWILTLQDRALPPAKQRSFIENLGGVDELVEIDSGHDVMISEPEQLAAMLAARAG